MFRIDITIVIIFSLLTVVVSLYNSNFLFFIYFVVTMAIFAIAFIKKKETEQLCVKKVSKQLSNTNQLFNARIQNREQNLNQALNIRSDILQNVGNQITIPINTVISHAELLQETLAEEGSKRYTGDIIEIMADAIRKFSYYIGGLVDVSDYQIDKTLLDIKKRNLYKLLQKISYNFYNVVINYEPHISQTIDIDEIRIIHALSNIINKINKMNKYQESVNVEICVKKGIKLNIGKQEIETIRIIIKDRGIFDERLSERSNVWDQNPRIKDILGDVDFILSEKIIEAHKGQIYVYNRGLKRGLNIEIILPIKHVQDRILFRNNYEENYEKNIEEGAGEKIDLKGIIEEVKNIDKKYNGKIPKILVIDDDKSTLESLKMLIRSLGYEFIGYKSAMEAIMYINGKGFDAQLVFLDMMLGDSDGFSVMSKIMKKIKLLKVPVVIQSGLSADDKLVMDAMKLGIDDFLGKPYSRKEVVEVIEKHLKLRSKDND